jgi:hypothetical protein
LMTSICPTVSPLAAALIVSIPHRPAGKLRSRDPFRDH